MTAPLYSTLLDALRESREEFLRAVEGMIDEEATWKPAPNRWSVLDCAEHVAMAESGMFRAVRDGTPATEPTPNNEGRKQRLMAAAVNRERKWVAPEPVRPNGRFASLAEAVEQFVSKRERTIRWMESCTDDLASLLTDHPVAGRITCEECLWLLIGHPLRHAAQIREIRQLHNEASRSGR